MNKSISRAIIAVAVLTAALLLIYRFWFLRMPERRIPHLDNVFVSPANGTIAGIQT
ncbi:MAG: hypothetical protein SH857_04965 [Chitinophagales bacterium]|nr:hypothetical protein [Chitinophagales bacterium]